MRFGIWTPLPHTIRADTDFAPGIADLSRRGAGMSSDRSFEYASDIVARAEKLGYETTLVASRWLGPDLEAWLLATALALRTSSIELIVATHPGIITAQVAAKFGASLDRFSGGRFAVNVINGWWEDEMNMFGNGAWLDKESPRYVRMSEFITVMKKLWDEEQSSFEGDFYKLKNAKLPIKLRNPNSPRVYAASRNPLGKDIVAKQCDVWFAEYQPDFRQFETSLSNIAADIVDMRARADSYGRLLEYGLSAHVICAKTMEEALDRAHELEAYGKQDRIALVAARAMGAGLIGTPEFIAERILRYRACGINCLMLHFYPMGEGMEVFSSEVMPLIAANARREGTSAKTQRMH